MIQVKIRETAEGGGEEMNTRTDNKVIRLILSKGQNIESMSKNLGANRDTLSRHLKDQAEKMPLQEVRKIARILELSDEEIIGTFFRG